MMERIAKDVLGRRGAVAGNRARREPGGVRRGSEALPMLVERLHAMQAQKDLMTRVNSRRRCGSQLDGDDAQAYMQAGGALRSFDEAEIRRKGAAIRRLELQIRETKRRADADLVEVQEVGYTYVEDLAGNRVSFRFLVRPCATVREALRDHGFRARDASQTDWGRVMNQPGLAAAKAVRTVLAEQ